MKFSTNFKKIINTRIGGLWGDKFNTQIVLDSEPNNTNESNITIEGEHIKCKVNIPYDEYISSKEINELIDSFSFSINKLNKKDCYKYSDIMNILCGTLLGVEKYNHELLTAVLNNETDVDEYVYDENDCEQEED